MHILFVLHSYSRQPANSGVHTYVLNITRSISDLGHCVSVLSACDGMPMAETLRKGGAEAGTVQVIRRPAGNRGFFVKALRRLGAGQAARWLAFISSELCLSHALRRLVGRMQVDAVVFIETFLLEGWLYSRRAAVPCIWSLLGGHYARMRFSPERSAEDLRFQEARSREMARRIPFLYGPSRTLASQAERDFDLPDGTVRALPCPLDESFLKASKHTGSGERTGVLFTGRFSPQKGLETLVAAAPAVLSRHPGTVFRLRGTYGRGAAAVAYEREIIAAIQSAGLTDRFEFVPRCTTEQMVDLYQHAAVCVFPTRWESFGYTAAEAMACGTPLVSTTAGAIPELVTPGRTGWLVEPDNPAQLAAAVNQVLDNPAAAAAIAAAAREEVRERYRPGVAGRQALEYFQHCAAKWHQERGAGGGRQ